MHCKNADYCKLGVNEVICRPCHISCLLSLDLLLTGQHECITRMLSSVLGMDRGQAYEEMEGGTQEEHSEAAGALINSRTKAKSCHWSQQGRSEVLSLSLNGLETSHQAELFDSTFLTILNIHNHLQTDLNLSHTIMSQTIMTTTQTISSPVTIFGA